MTVLALLEPPPGLGPVVTEMDFSHPWSLRLIDWQPDWGVPPHGLEMKTVAGRLQLTGFLKMSQLQEWIQVLLKEKKETPARILQQAIDAHKKPNPILNWGDGKNHQRLDLSRPRIMGIINLTPDSFSQDGLGDDVEAAIAQGERMVAAGADILDVGGESTRPGAEQISVAAELARVIPVVSKLAKRVSVPISVDSRKAAVMKAALAAGASLINDVMALEQVATDDFVTQLAANDVPVVLMHMRGTPATMQEHPHYQDVVAEVYDYLASRVAWCEQQGIRRERLIIDPGIGFGKSTAHNLELLRHLRVFRSLGLPLLLGVSRKRLVGALTGETDAARRDGGSHVLAALGALSGGAHILRVHDVVGAVQALAIAHGWVHGPDPGLDNNPDCGQYIGHDPNHRQTHRLKGAA